MSVSLFNALSPRGSAGAPAGAVEVLLDEENQPWFKRAHVGKYLGHAHISTSLEGLNSEESRPRSVFGASYRSTVGWSGPKCEQCKTDVFLSVYGVMHAVVNSRKSRGKELRDWILRDVVPLGFNKLMEEDHQKAIDEKQKAIDEKDMQLALLNDDLTQQRGYDDVDSPIPCLLYTSPSPRDRG